MARPIYMVALCRRRVRRRARILSGEFQEVGRLDAGRERRPLRMLGLVVHLGKRPLGIRPARHLPHGWKRPQQRIGKRGSMTVNRDPRTRASPGKPAKAARNPEASHIRNDRYPKRRTASRPRAGKANSVRQPRQPSAGSDKNYRKPYFENGTAIEHNRNDAETVPDIRQKNGDNKEECMEYHIILTI